RVRRARAGFRHAGRPPSRESRRPHRADQPRAPCRRASFRRLVCRIAQRGCGAGSARSSSATRRTGAVRRRPWAASATGTARGRRLAELELRARPGAPLAARPGSPFARNRLPHERIVIRRVARLEWFLGSALVLLAARLGFRAWHNPSHSPRWSVILEESPIHPFLAEYECRVRI